MTSHFFSVLNILTMLLDRWASVSIAESKLVFDNTFFRGKLNAFIMCVLKIHLAS